MSWLTPDAGHGTWRRAQSSANSRGTRCSVATRFDVQQASVLDERRDLAPKLAGAGLAIFWTVRADNELHENDHAPLGGGYRWVSASASYVLRGERIERLSSQAARCMPEAVAERELAWVTKEIES